MNIRQYRAAAVVWEAKLSGRIQNPCLSGARAGHWRVQGRSAAGSKPEILRTSKSCPQSIDCRHRAALPRTGGLGHLRTLALRQKPGRSFARRPFITASTSAPIAARADPSAGTIAAAKTTRGATNHRDMAAAINFGSGLWPLVARQAVYKVQIRSWGP